MRRTASIGITVLMALLAISCSSTDTPDTSPPTSVESAPPVTDPPTTVPQGANAAPPAGGIYDASQTAADNYRLWLTYEMALPQDLNREYETEAYPDGVSVCAKLATGTDVRLIEDHLSGTRGYTRSGAAAIIKGAVQALCPHRNQGYMTYFDRQVVSATTALTTSMSWSPEPPPYYEIGYFMKFTCAYLQQYGSATNLEVTLHSYRLGGSNQATGGSISTFVQRFGLDDQLLRRATHHAVFNGCLGDHGKLNGYWTMA